MVPGPPLSIPLKKRKSQYRYIYPYCFRTCAEKLLTSLFHTLEKKRPEIRGVVCEVDYYNSI